MSDYTIQTNFRIKDGLAHLDPDKLVTGSELMAEFEAIQDALNSKADASTAAVDVTYDNGSSGLSSTTVQDAIDEVVSEDNIVPLNSQSGTTYTLVLTDKGKCVEMNNASANTLTVPPNSSVAFPIGTALLVRQMGAGTTSIAAGAGVTIRTPSTLDLQAQYSLVSLHKRATNEWCVEGGIA